MDDLIRLIDIVAWPATTLFAIWLVRKQIRALVPLIQRIKYKEFEVEFSKRLTQINEDIGEPSPLELREAKASKLVSSLADISPSSAIIEAWKGLEQSARNKVKELMPKGETFRNPLQRPIEYLEFKGALIPSTAIATGELRLLRNEAAHADVDDISKEDVIQYATAANRIRLQIEAITELPVVKLTALTSLVRELNYLIDSKKYDDVTIEEVYGWIDAKNVLPSLKERTGDDSDLSIYGADGPYSNFADFYHEEMEKLSGGYAGDHQRKWGVENLGLCLLLAWTNELIQGGAGWHPTQR